MATTNTATETWRAVHWGGVIAGALMNIFGLSAERILASIGLTPIEAWEYLARFIAWAIPNVLLGAIVILPLWFCAYLFIPPRAHDE